MFCFPFYILIYIDCIFNLCICQVKCGFHPIRKRVGFRHKFITNQYTKHHDGNIRKILFRSLCKIHKLPALPIVLTLSSLLPLLILSYKCHLSPISASIDILSNFHPFRAIVSVVSYHGFFPQSLYTSVDPTSLQSPLQRFLPD